MKLAQFLEGLSDEPDWTHVEEVDVMTRGASGDSPLHAALWAGDDEAARELVDAGADVNAPGEESYTPLHVAVAKSNASMVRLLVERGASWHSRSELGSTPMEDARRSENPDIRALADG